jgi:hypothetical protein
LASGGGGNRRIIAGVNQLLTASHEKTLLIQFVRPSPADSAPASGGNLVADRVVICGRTVLMSKHPFERGGFSHPARQARSLRRQSTALAQLFTGGALLVAFGAVAAAMWMNFDPTEALARVYEQGCQLKYAGWGGLMVLGTGALTVALRKPLRAQASARMLRRVACARRELAKH